jgi:hypothetical protein
MSNAHHIDTACYAVEGLVSRLDEDLRRENYGILNMLRECARTGGFVHPDMIDAKRLTDAAQTLRELAQEISDVRELLDANERASYHLQAAE